MHACGHDIHMSAWAGTARLMAEHKDRWHGTLMMVGQPAEESGWRRLRDAEGRPVYPFPATRFCALSA